MPVCAGRLSRTVVLLAITSASFGFAAGLIAQALLDLEAYLKAASTLVLQVATGLDEAELDTLPAPERRDAADQLRRLSDDLREIFLSQTNLVHNLEFYIGLAKEPGRTPKERESFWNSSVLTPARDIYRSVDTVRRLVEVNPLFSVTLSEDQQRALADNLGARAVVLRSFEDMPPPASGEEILQLEGVVSHYKILIENLRTLRGAVDAALRRLQEA